MGICRGPSKMGLIHRFSQKKLQQIHAVLGCLHAQFGSAPNNHRNIHPMEESPTAVDFFVLFFGGKSPKKERQEKQCLAPPGYLAENGRGLHNYNCAYFVTWFWIIFSITSKILLSLLLLFLSHIVTTINPSSLLLVRYIFCCASP